MNLIFYLSKKLSFLKLRPRLFTILVRKFIIALVGVPENQGPLPQF